MQVDKCELRRARHFKHTAQVEAAKLSNNFSNGHHILEYERITTRCHNGIQVDLDYRHWR